MRIPLIPVLLAAAACASAADLGSELAWWSPLATDEHPITDGNCFALGAVTASGGADPDGLFLVDRPRACDVQVAGGYAYDRSQEGEFGDYEWGRFYARGGTDPLSERAGCPFAAAGAAVSLPLLLSFQVEAGYSRDRKELLGGEVSLVFARVRLERDDRVRTLRIGTGPRILGTTGPLAWGALLDYARSSARFAGQDYDRAGAMTEGFVMWRPLNHLLLAAELQVASHTVEMRSPTEEKDPVIGGALAVGAVF
jgi:hypothetical protein